MIEGVLTLERLEELALVFVCMATLFVACVAMAAAALGISCRSVCRAGGKRGRNSYALCLDPGTTCIGAFAFSVSSSRESTVRGSLCADEGVRRSWARRSRWFATITFPVKIVVRTLGIKTHLDPRDYVVRMTVLPFVGVVGNLTLQGRNDAWAVFRISRVSETNRFDCVGGGVTLSPNPLAKTEGGLMQIFSASCGAKVRGEAVGSTFLMFGLIPAAVASGRSADAEEGTGSVIGTHWMIGDNIAIKEALKKK